MRISILTLISFLVFSGFHFSTDFLSKQKSYSRVRTAYQEKEQIILGNLKKHSIDISTINILIMAFKQEKELVIYAKNKSENIYKEIASYPICASSGTLGPKRKQGDEQVPEGFYHIDRFNPVSSFYLSLGINYPNQSDKIKSKASNLGGDIFIHGWCLTIGCLPMTDEKIKEIYIYAIQAYQSGQTKIPVYVFPFKMTDEKIDKYKTGEPLANFWRNLKTGYDAFIKSKKELNVVVSENGNYVFNE